jgi:N-acetyltransferase
MITLDPIVLEGFGVRLEPLRPQHRETLVAAAADGDLWELWYTSIPNPTEADQYVANALEGQSSGSMLPWAVRDLKSNEIVGSTRFHDVVAEIDRVEIGYTWYAKRWQRTHVNTACKRLLLAHAFDQLGCAVVGFRTDKFNFASQKAIEGLGAKKDGMIRHYAVRRDGTPRDIVMYSILRSEWPEVKRHLEWRLQRNGALRESGE